MKKIPELLAPAGSPESLKAAVDAGADAVYLSGKNFGARQFAENFSLKEMSKSVNYAHLRGLKIYVTVNTLIKDSEMLSASKYILKLYQMGVDAILVQDMGLIKLAREIVPELDLHASTQMTTHNVENLKWLEKDGFKRAVLSRELSLDEIKLLNKSTDLELGVFLHGALCYCYSGQCLLSSFIGGRSGNRGMCAQPCRKPYSLVWGMKDGYGRPGEISQFQLKEDYLLSTRDLAHYAHLDLLVNSGIRSLKIEGRMRSPEYVSVVVGTYRRALDKIAQGNWKPSSKDLENLKLAFNRGFTSGYLLPKSKNKIVDRKKPGHRGLYLGEVKNYNTSQKKVMISLKTVNVPQKGDGLFFESANKKASTGFDLNVDPVQKGKDLIISARKPVKSDSKVYLTRRNDLKKSLKSNKPVRKMFNLELTFKVLENKLPELVGKLDGPKGPISVKIQGKIALEKAKTRPTSVEQIKNQILKVGDKPFKASFNNLNYSGDLFLPLKEVNQLRRDLIDKIETEIIQSYSPPPNNFKSSLKSHNLFKEKIRLLEHSEIQIPPSNFSLSAYANEIKSLKGALNSGLDRIYFEPNLFSPQEIYEMSFDSQKFLDKYFEYEFDSEEFINILNKSYDLCENKNVNLVWKWPEITRNHVLDILKRLFLETSHLDLGIMVAHPGIAQYINNNNNNNKCEIYGSPALNIWNNQSISHLSPLFSVLTLSPELSLQDIESVFNNFNDKSLENSSPAQLEVIVQGNLESMVSQQCILSENLLSSSQREMIKEKNQQGNLFLGLKDSKNQIFPLKISSDGQTILKNSTEVSLIDHLPSLIQAGAGNFAIDGRDKGPHYLEKMSKYYKKALNESLEPSEDFKVEKLKNKIKKISLGGITAGNFIRGVN